MPGMTVRPPSATTRSPGWGETGPSSIASIQAPATTIVQCRGGFSPSSSMVSLRIRRVMALPGGKIGKGRVAGGKIGRPPEIFGEMAVIGPGVDIGESRHRICGRFGRTEDREIVAARPDLLLQPF